MSGTSCSGENFETRGCCYAGDDGADCDRDQLLADGDDIFNEWNTALGEEKLLLKFSLYIFMTY